MARSAQTICAAAPLRAGIALMPLHAQPSPREHGHAPHANSLVTVTPTCTSPLSALLPCIPQAHALVHALVHAWSCHAIHPRTPHLHSAGTA